MATKNPTHKKYCVSAAEKKVRVHEVFEQLLEGKATTTVAKFAMEKWGISIQTAYKYMELSNKLMAETLAGKKKDRINRAVVVRDRLIEKLIAQGGYAAALQGLADRDKMLGLYESDKNEVNVTIEVHQE